MAQVEVSEPCRRPLRPSGGTDGFTLIELIVVIVLIAILAAVAIPRFINLSGEAIDSSRCAAARAAINATLYVTYTALLAADPSQQDWMETTTYEDLSDTMFASGAVPVCPSGGSLTISNGVCICSLHGE